MNVSTATLVENSTLRRSCGHTWKPAQKVFNIFGGYVFNYRTSVKEKLKNCYIWFNFKKIT